MDEESLTFSGIPFEDIQMSEKTSDLMQAWIKAKIELGSVVKKEGVNPHFRNSKYATLDATLQRGEPVLARHGLGILQMPTDNRLVNLLFHESGQWISFRYRMAPVKNDSQALGSALTYSRRYCFQSICMLSGGDDDDGEAAMARDEKKSAQKSAQPPPPKNALLETPEPKPKPRKKAYTGIKSILAEAEEFDFKNPAAPDPNLAPIDPEAPEEISPAAHVLGVQIGHAKTLERLQVVGELIGTKKFEGSNHDYLKNKYEQKKEELNGSK